MNNPKVQVKWGDRWAIVGGTGSGKTTFANNLLAIMGQAAQWRLPIYIIDSKMQGDFTKFHQRGVGRLFQGNVIPTIPNTLKDGCFTVIQPEIDDKDYYNDLFQFFYDHRKMKMPAFILVDELSSITGGSGAPPRAYEVIQKQGRGINIGCASLTQSAMYIPPSLLRQSTHCLVFNVNSDKDKKKLEELLGNDVYKPLQHEHGFLYRNVTKPRTKSPTRYYADFRDFF